VQRGVPSWAQTRGKPGICLPPPGFKEKRSELEKEGNNQILILKTIYLKKSFSVPYIKGKAVPVLN
jgi:hypothetical protein